MLNDVRVPFAPFIPHIQRYLASTDQHITVLSAQAGLHEDTLERMIRRPVKTVAFNTVDKLLCCMNETTLWRSDPVLAEIYQQTDFGGAVEYDPAAQFACGHPRTSENTRSVSSKGRRRGGGVTCRRCDNERRGRRAGCLRDQLSLTREGLAA